MIIYEDDGTVINMLDAMEIICYTKKHITNSRRNKYVAKLQEWKSVYDNLGPGWMFSGGCVAVKI